MFPRTKNKRNIIVNKFSLTVLFVPLNVSRSLCVLKKITVQFVDKNRHKSLSCQGIRDDVGDPFSVFYGKCLSVNLVKVVELKI